MTTPTVLRTFGSMSDKPTREICHEAATLIERQAAQIKMMREALKEIRDDFDCDADAHKYGTTCRCCLAEEVLSTTPDQALEKFAARVREQCAQHFIDLGSAYGYQVAAEIHAIKELP